jgi:hypothetical protein
MRAIFRLFPVVLATLAILLPALPAIAADPVAQPGLPTDVPADWWSQVQGSIQLEEYGVVAEGTAGTEFRAANPAHKFEARFDAAGLRPRETGSGVCR